MYYLVPKHKQKASVPFLPLFLENRNSEQTRLLTAVKYEILLAKKEPAKVIPNLQ